VVVGASNIPLSPIDRSCRQKNQQRNPTINDTIDQMDITDVYKIFHPAIAQYTFLSAAHGTLFKDGTYVGHKASLNNYEKVEITPCNCLITRQ
jgi:hypothetical protein